MSDRHVLLADVYYNRRRCRQNWFCDRSVSIPPHLRPIEEESENEDQSESLSVDCSNSCQVVMSSAGARDVITPRPISERTQRDVIANGRCAFDEDSTGYDVTESPSCDCRQPVNKCTAIRTGRCLCNEGGTYSSGDNYVTHNDVTGESSSCDSRLPINGAETCRIERNSSTPDVVTEEAQSRQCWGLGYVIVALLVAFVACLTVVSPSCIIFIVIMASLLTPHLIQS